MPFTSMSGKAAQFARPQWWMESQMRRQLIIRIETVTEVDPFYADICMYLYPYGFDVVGTVCTARKVSQIELDLIPTGG